MTELKIKAYENEGILKHNWSFEMSSDSSERESEFAKRLFILISEFSKEETRKALNEN